MNGYKIQQLDLVHHVEQVMKIEREAFPNSWPKEIIEESTKRSKYFCRVSLDIEVVNGFCISNLIYDEVHILQIAVHKDYRRRGIARDLLIDSFDFHKGIGVKRAILEVATSNYKALNLYKKMGFEIIRIRKNYYRSIEEDAFVMMLGMEKN